MALEATHNKIKNQSDGHKNHNMQDTLRELIVRYAKADEESQKLNEVRTQIRKEVEALGIDTKAFQDRLNRAKADLKKRDGYDEGAAVVDSVIGTMKMEDLFEHVLRKDREKAAAAEAKKTEREQKKIDKLENKAEKKAEKTQAQIMNEPLN